MIINQDIERNDQRQKFPKRKLDKKKIGEIGKQVVNKVSQMRGDKEEPEPA